LVYIAVARLDENLKPQRSLVLDFGSNRSAYEKAHALRSNDELCLPYNEWRVEKNWQFLRLRRRINCVYTIDPHVVLQLMRSAAR